LDYRLSCAILSATTPADDKFSHRKVYAAKPFPPAEITSFIVRNKRKHMDLNRAKPFSFRKKTIPYFH